MQDTARHGRPRTPIQWALAAQIEEARVLVVEWAATDDHERQGRLIADAMACLHTAMLLLDAHYCSIAWPQGGGAADDRIQDVR